MTKNPSEPDFTAEMLNPYGDVQPDPKWGYIKYFLNKDDPHPAREQFNEKYVSGWSKFEGFKFDPNTFRLHYSDDPDMLPIAAMGFRDERIFLYPHAWVLILQKDGTYEVARMD